MSSEEIGILIWSAKRDPLDEDFKAIISILDNDKNTVKVFLKN
jgi:hypothetical protein